MNSDHQKDRTSPAQPGDLALTFRTLYRRKLLIVAGVLAFTLFAFILSCILPKTYRSRGFFQLSDPSQGQAMSVSSVAAGFLESPKFLVFSQLQDAGMLDVLEVLKDKELPFDEPRDLFLLTIQDFKKFSARFKDFPGFFAFARERGKLSEEESADLRSHVPDSRQLSKFIQGVYALSRDDLKDVGRSLEGEKNYIAGVSLAMEAGTPKQTQKFLGLLGEYIRYNTLHEKINDYAAANLGQFKALGGRYAADILRNRNLLRQLEQKKGELKSLLGRYPSFSPGTGERLPKPGFNDSRYLSPGAQVVGVESRIIDLKGLIERFALEKKKADLFCGYFGTVQTLLDAKFTGGESLLKKMEDFKEEYLKGLDPADPAAAAVANSLTTDIGKFRVLFSRSLRFVSGPTLPLTPVRPTKSVYTAFGFFLGILVFVSLAFILEFWKKNRAYIKGSGSE